MQGSSILPLDQLVETLAPLRRAGKTVALANGLFDLLHVGHLRYLQAAKNEADVLVVALNSDDSARSLKGPSRPLVPQQERAELVSGLSCVDFVTIFDDSSVDEVLRVVQPHVHCKGTDYTPDSVPERAVAQQLGIRIAIVGDPKSHATRDLIRQIRSGESEAGES